MRKPKLEWAAKGDTAGFDAAKSYLSLLTSDAAAARYAAALRRSQPVEYAAKDLLRSAQLPLLPRDDPHVDADLKRIAKGKALSPVLLVQGDMTKGLPLTVADGYHRICAVVYFDESALVRCRIVSSRGTTGNSN
jgi:hypothetical protein